MTERKQKVNSAAERERILYFSVSLFLMLLVNRLASPVYITLDPAAKGTPGPDELFILDDSHELAKVNWDRRHVPLAPFALALITLI